MRLAAVPQVIKMMNDHLDWTTQLGDTFLAKPVEIMDTIQALRKRATDSGFLKDTPEQKVTAKTVSVEQPAEGTWVSDDTNAQGTGATIKATPAVLKKEVISIEPAKADTVYVPQYNPETAYQAPLAPPPATGDYPASTVVNVNQSAAPVPGYYPSYYPASPATNPMLTFGAGAVVGGLLTWGIMEWADNDDWDDYHHVGHYYGNTVCRNGNCWHGGGGGYYGDRGNFNATGTPTSTGVGLSPAMKSISTVAATSARTVSNLHNGPPAGNPISAIGEDRPIRKRYKNGSAQPNNPLWPDSGSVLPRHSQLEHGDLPKPANGLPQELCQPSAGHPVPTFRNASRKSPEPRTSSRTNWRNQSRRRVTFKSGLGRVPGIMLCKASKTRVRHREWKAREGRKAAKQLHPPLVIFKRVNRQAQSVSSARRLKGPASPPRKGSLRPRSGKPRCQNKQGAARPLAAN